MSKFLCAQRNLMQKYIKRPSLPNPPRFFLIFFSHIPFFLLSFNSFSLKCVTFAEKTVPGLRKTTFFPETRIFYLVDYDRKSLV